MATSSYSSFTSTQGGKGSNYSSTPWQNAGRGAPATNPFGGKDYRQQNRDSVNNAFQGALAGANDTLQRDLFEAGDKTTKLGFDYSLAEAKLPWDYKQGVFNQTFPLVQGLLGNNGGGFNSDFGTVGGSNTPLPNLPNDFVYSGDQVQQQVNAARATADQGAAVQKKDLAGTLGGRGFSGRSPIAMAMDQAADSAGRMQGADQERQIRFDAAGANANQALGVGNLAQDAWSAFNNADIERRKSQLNAMLGTQSNMASLISALSGLGG